MSCLSSFLMWHGAFSASTASLSPCNLCSLSRWTKLPFSENRSLACQACLGPLVRFRLYPRLPQTQQLLVLAFFACKTISRSVLYQR
ncbi:hypothetical protein B0T21DRAFT_374742 [Apiosordaria backusii]|uniref:Secreted protein n=1 Tax=Apiosordaria backusii TaxID=314023 RepID=A0AA40ANG8_9PEZI|nr:hypothetical protein B0T21DRAFT_374742 [Apiosordaria backusii]